MFSQPVALKYEKRYFWSFLWAMVLAADLICVSFFLAGERNLRRYAVNDFNQQVIQEFVDAKDQADVSVIMLGNSRMRHAATFGFKPASEIQTLPDGRKVVGLQFALNAARFELYDFFSHRLLNAEPDIMIIQNSVISNALGVEPNAVKVSEIIYDYYYKILTGFDEEAEWWDDRLWIFRDCRFAYDAANAKRRIEFQMKDNHSLGAENQNYKMSRDFIRQALDRGIKVVIINIMPYMDHFDRQNVEMHILDFNGLGFYPTNEELLPDLHDRVTWATYDVSRSESDFCDDIHFSDEGRENFMDWYLQKISDWAQ